eukprot:6914531-Pyramimonas_sp.AAC.1
MASRERCVPRERTQPPGPSRQPAARLQGGQDWRPGGPRHAQDAAHARLAVMAEVRRDQLPREPPRMDRGRSSAKGGQALFSAHGRRQDNYRRHAEGKSAQQRTQGHTR